MSHKRAFSNGEIPAAKKMSTQDSSLDDTQDVYIPAAAYNTTVDPLWIYVATREVHDPYMPPTHDVLEAYATVRDANWGIKHLQKDDDCADNEWEELYDINGCLCLSTEGGEGEQIELKIMKVPMMVAGTVEPPEDVSESEEDDGEEQVEDGGNDVEEASSPAAAEEEEEEEEEEEDDEEDEDEPENGYDEIAAIKEAQQKGGEKVDCHASGCGAALCSSCWPQTEEEWEAVS